MDKTVNLSLIWRKDLVLFNLYRNKYSIYIVMKISNFLLTSLALTSLLSISLNSKALNVGGKTVGQVTEHTVTVDEHCSWNDSRNGEAIHALQEGQVIIGYEKIGSSTWEGSGFDTDVTPAKYTYNSYSKSIAEYKNKILDAEASGNGEEYKARLEQELNALQEAASKLETSHSTFAIDWRCKGSGNAFDQKRGKVYASYKVRVMSLPSPQAVETYLASGQSIESASQNASEDNVRLEGSNIYLGGALIDNNPKTIQVIEGSNGVFQLHNDGQIWQWLGKPCDGNSCPHWVMIDNNPATKKITTAGDLGLFQLHNDGKIWQWKGQPCNGGSCPHWVMLDNNSSTVDIFSDGSRLLQRHNSGQQWEWLGEPCSDWCHSWKTI